MERGSCLNKGTLAQRIHALLAPEGRSPNSLVVVGQAVSVVEVGLVAPLQQLLLRQPVLVVGGRGLLRAVYPLHGGRVGAAGVARGERLVKVLLDDRVYLVVEMLLRAEGILVVGHFSGGDNIQK